MKSITGQYECSHSSGIGLDYFTSRLDRLTLLAKGRFTLLVQERSRISHAAKSLLSGQQVDTNAPETRREGGYTYQGDSISFFFDDGSREQGQLSANGIQIGKDFFEKVSDSTFLPPVQRTQSYMEDIAKGLKIAGAIGGAALKAAKTVQDTLQTAQGAQPGQASRTPSQGTYQQNQGAPQSSQAAVQTPATVPPAQGAASEQDSATLFCDQCGSPVRPGKRFCNHCGARLP
ncbi:MAG TPA: zinc ribbon domain-containing protein [Ktedonobacteraceae bacterium]|nr:zinc ribbon domain-containing protein [Ktedonobacteraceae bacterium]